MRKYRLTDFLGQAKKLKTLKILSFQLHFSSISMQFIYQFFAYYYIKSELTI